MESKSKRKRSLALEKARTQADAHFGQISKAQVQQMTSDSDSMTRLLGLMLIRKHIGSGGSPLEYADIAEALVGDPDNNCRWQAAIVTCECIKHNPEVAWRVVHKYGDSSDADMRMAIATNLLEELLEFDFDTYFPKVKEEVQAGHIRFLDTLGSCWFDNQTGRNYQKAQRYIQNAMRGRSSITHAG